MWTPEKEARLQQLGTELGFFGAPTAPTEAPVGFMGFLGQHAANILPSALEKIVQPAQSMLFGGMVKPEEGAIPRFFDTRAPEGIGEKVVAGGAELLSYLPAIALTEGLGTGAIGQIGVRGIQGAEALEAAGLTARAAALQRPAKIAGAGLGFAYPSAPQGPESAALQGGVGALQTAAMDWGWRGKLAAGVIGAGAGYYEGAKQSPETGAMMAGLNLLGPTLIDPIVNKMLGANKAAAEMGKQGEEASKVIKPHAPTGNIMQDAFDQMTDAQKRAHVAALTGLSEPPPVVPNQPQAGFFGDFSVNPGGGQPLIRNPIPPLAGTFEGGARTRREGLEILPPLQPDVMGTGSGFTYGERGLDPFDAFASLQREPIARTEGFLTGFEPRMRLGERAGTSSELYGGQGNVYDVFGGVQQRPSTEILSPREKAIQAKVIESHSLSEPAPAPAKASRIIAPEGSEVPKPLREGAHVIASAVKHKGKILVSGQHNAPHEKIGIEHGITTGVDSVPEGQRGFLVQNADGTQGFANRKRAAKIAFKSGQLKEAVGELKSESPWSEISQLHSSNLADPPSAQPQAMKAGDNLVHWNDDGMPLDVVVTKVEDGVVHYKENDFTTGQLSEKVASLQEFQNLELHPSERPKVTKSTVSADEVMIAENMLRSMENKVWDMKNGKMGRVTQKVIREHEKEIERLRADYENLREKRRNPSKPVEPAGLGPIKLGSSQENIREVTLKDGTKFEVDASLAPIVQKVNDLGFKTAQSASGVKADYTSNPGRHTPGGYIAFYLADLTERQVAKIKAAAHKVGLNIEDKKIFFQPAVTVRTGASKEGKYVDVTSDEIAYEAANRVGLSKEQLHGSDKKDERLFGGPPILAPNSKEVGWDKFLEFLSARDKIGKEIIDSQGGYIDDAETISRWKKFEEALQESDEVASLQPANQVRIKGRFGTETATIVSRKGNTLHVEVDDPIFGKRQTSVLESDVLPAESTTPIPKGGVPFKDVPGAKNQLDAANEPYGGEGGLLGSADEEPKTQLEWLKQRLQGVIAHPSVQAYKTVVEREEQLRAKIKDVANRYNDWHKRNDKHDDLVRKTHNEVWDALVREKGEQFLTGDAQSKIVDSPVANIALKNIDDAQNKFLNDPTKKFNVEQHEAVIAERNRLSAEGDALIKERQQYDRELTSLQKEYSKFNSKEHPEEFTREIEEYLSVTRRIKKQKGGDEILGSVMEGHGPIGGKAPYAIKGKTVLEIQEALKFLPPEAATIIGELIQRIQVAAGKQIDVHFAREMKGSKGGMYEQSGKIGLNLQWVHAVVKNWQKMSPTAQANSAMRFASLLGHEISHIAHKFGERSQLLIDGKPITQLVMKKIDGFTQQQREYIIRQIQDAKGEANYATSKYLSGDLDTVHAWYKKRRPDLTMDQAKELAAGEVLAEISSIELIKRMEVQGLPDKLREAINKFKQVIINVIDWFRGQNKTSEVAGLQKLSEISNIMFDHFKGADNARLEGAFPSSTIWKAPTPPNPFSSVSTAPPMAGSEVVQPFMKAELVRLGVRAAIGAGAGAAFGPANISTSESVIAGGVLGAFGPMVVRGLLNKEGISKLIAAAKAAKGGPFASLQVLTGGKNLRQLGEEGRYGMRGDGSALAKVVRLAEQHLSVNLDPKIKAIWEQAHGILGEQIMIIEDALKKARWVKPSQGVRDATDQFIEGKIDKDQYRALLPDDPAKNYGELMIAAREATTVATDLLAQGMRKTQLRDAIIANRESYVMRSYKAYRDGEFDMKYFDKVKQDLMDANVKEGLDDANADAILREHMVEVKANRSVFSQKRGTGEQSIEGKVKFRRLATEEEIFMQQLEVGSLEHDTFGKAYQEAKAKLDWMETHRITDNWRGWLGEIKDPTQRMLYTFQKVHPSAIAASIYDLLDNGIDSIGNKFAMTAKELTNARSLLESEIAKGGAGVDVASLQQRLSALESYTPLPEGAQYGKLSGKFTDRFVRDQISTYDTPYKWMDQPVLRGISAINNVVKINRTVLNPLTVLRNYMQIPMFMLIGKATPRDVWEAAKVLHKGLDPELLSLMRRRHILGVDYASSELTSNLGNMVSGYFDSDAAVRIARAGYDKAREIYQQPDMLQRAGTFIAARKRYSKRMNLDINDPRVTDAAVEWTDRFTMNYSAVPRVIKAARQLPFVSLFVSYASEITRILKNLTVEAISGKHLDDRMHAVGILAGMAALPALLTTAFESNLSPKDQKDWQKLRQLQPDYARSRFYLPLSREKDGRFRYMDITSMIPADNYTQMMKSAINGDMQGAIAANPFTALQDTPLLNIATEQISGTDLRTGRSVEGLLGRTREVLKEILPPIVPPGYEGERLAKAFSRNEMGGWGLTNLKTGVQTRPSDIVAAYMTGLRFSNVSLASVQKSAIATAQQQIAHEQQLLKDIINTNTTGAQKVEARNRYTRSVQEIMASLHYRLGEN